MASEWVRMVCAGLPLAPLISRWTRAQWSAGLPRILQHSRESSLLPTFPPVDIDGLNDGRAKRRPYDLAI
jgi:hypothetical protein